MFLIILGIFIVVVGIFMSSQDTQASRFGNVVRIAGVFVIFIGALTSMFKVIDAGQVGVKSVFGKVD